MEEMDSQIEEQNVYEEAEDAEDDFLWKNQHKYHVII